MPSSVNYLTGLTQLGYEFRYNEVTDRVEVNNQPISDVIEAQIRTRMRDQGYTRMREVEDTYLAHAWEHRYHPIRDYLTGLVWDGQPNIERLASHFTDRHGMFPVFLRRWLIGAVAKAFGRTQTFMLVMAGEQGTGKSFFADWLCPAELKTYKVESAIDTNNKDIWRRLVTHWIWEVGEFGQVVRRSDREALKDFISRLDVTVRPPYGKHDITRPALASLLATVNNEGPGFLGNDSSGSRRFATVDVQIDWGYTALNLSQIWAEAYTAYQAGESWELSQSEREQQAEINEEYEMESGVEGFLLKYYDLDPNGQNWETGVNIIQELETFGMKGVQIAMLMELSRVLKRNKIERKRIRGVWSYRGVTRKPALGVTI